MSLRRGHLPVIFGFAGLLLEPAPALAADGRGFDHGTVAYILYALVGIVVAAIVIAGLEILRQRTHLRGSERATRPVVSISYAQRLHGRLVFGLMPALVATAIVLLRTHDFSTAAFLFASMLLAAAVLRTERAPLHLMPIARYAYNALVPAAGVGLALLPGVFGESLIEPSAASAALIAAVIVTVIGGILEGRFENARPIWVAIVGPSDFAKKLVAELEDTGIRGYEVIGYIGEEPEDEPDVRWLGYLDDVRSAVQRERIDLLVVAPQSPRLPLFDQLARELLDLPVRMIEATALYEGVLGHVPIGTINSAWFQFIMHPNYSPSSPLSKRALDLVVSGGMVALATPLMLLCALAVKLEDRGPVFYRQRRVGEEGREFDMIKFRTLRTDADELRSTHTEDELITRVGRVLRKAHFNELPQLVQVLRGEMSLVGPRPEPPGLVQELSGLVPFYERRALVKPGLTGWAQVRCGYAGSAFGTAWKMCHDLYYIKHRSARLDLLILIQTLHALVEREEVAQVPAKDFILGEAELAGHGESTVPAGR